MVSKKWSGSTCEAESGEAGGELGGEPWTRVAMALQAFGAVVDGVHAGHDGEQDLRGADVGGGLLAADVLLAGLEGEAVGLGSAGVDGDADEAAGQVALEFVAGGEEGGVGAAVAHGDAEALGGADGEVGAEFAGRGEQGEGEGVGGHDGDGSGGVEGGDGGAVVDDLAVGAGVLEDGAEDVVSGLRSVAASPMMRLQPKGLARVSRRAMVWGWQLRSTKKTVDVGLGSALGHGHGLGGGGGLVEQRGVGDVEAGEVADHGLEVDEGFETALRDFGLVGGVGGVPGGVLEDVALDDGGDEGAVVALADERGEDLILGGDGAEVGDGLDLGERGAEGELAGGEDGGGDGLGDELVDGVEADGAEAWRDVGGGGADVAAGEAVEAVEG